MHEAPALQFIPGLVVKEEFYDYKSLQNGAKNYLNIKKFRLGSGPFYGIHAGIQLNHMQVGYSDRHEGLMYEEWTPKECVTIGVLKKSDGALNINHLKVCEGEIVMIDDSAPHNFASAGRALFAVTSIRKALIAKVVPQILDGLDQVYKDKNDILLNCIMGIAEETVSKPEHLFSKDEIEGYEARVMEALCLQFSTLEPIERSLSAHEKIAFDVKDYMLENLKEDFSIAALTEEFSISDKSLENHFSALFGITPKKLITMFKLNQAHEEICHANKSDVSVTDVAIRWGFTHLGRFSNSYKEVFGTFPSEDLKLTS